MKTSNIIDFGYIYKRNQEDLNDKYQIQQKNADDRLFNKYVGKYWNSKKSCWEI